MSSLNELFASLAQISCFVQRTRAKRTLAAGTNRPVAFHTLARNQEHCACSAAGGCNRIAAMRRRVRVLRLLLIIGVSVTGLSAPPRQRPLTARRATDGGFSLDGVRDSLIRQEETIIFALIERAQYARNAEIYDRDAYSTS